MIGSGARYASAIASMLVCALTANRKRRGASGADRDGKSMQHNGRCPAWLAVRRGSRPLQLPPREPRRLRKFRRGERDGRSADHIGQKAQEAGALDRLGEFALLAGADRGDPGGHDLAALGDVTRQQARVLVVDLRRIGARERAGFAAAEETGGGARRPSDCSNIHIIARAAREGDRPVARSPRSPVAARSARSAIVAVAVLALAQHRRRARLMLVDANGEDSG